MSETFIVEIDQLPEERIAATTPQEASRKVAEIIATRQSLQSLADDEPVQIKHADRRPWGRNLTLGAYRTEAVDHDCADPGGPVHRPSV